MRIGFSITVRMKSTRLQKKAMLKINGREILAIMIERLRLCKLLDEIIVATSINKDDVILCDLAKRENVRCFRGSEDDVLERLYLAGMKYKIDYLLNLTADCPLVAFDFIEKMVEKYKESNADLITISKLPHGFYFWGMKMPALKKVIEIKKGNDTEVWIRYFTDTGLFKLADVEVPKEFQRANYRLSVDYREDYEFFKALFGEMGRDTHLKPTKDIINFLDAHPEIVKINENCEKLYKKRWQSQNKLLLKKQTII